MSDAQRIENWRAIDGFPGYEISDQGRVRHWHGGYPLNKGGYRRAFFTILTPTGPRYLRIALCDGKKAHTRYIHRLVAAAFIGRCPDGKEVNHKDADKMNNSVDNLEYITGDDNKQHAVARKLFRHGVRHYTARFTEEDVREIRRLHADGTTVKTIADRFQTHHTTIIGIVRKTRWKHLS